MELEKNYELFRKKHLLPSFEELDAAFEVHCIDDGKYEGKFLLNDIRQRIIEKIDELCITLEDILQPDTKVSNLYESRVFTDSDKEKIFKIFKRLMTIKRKALQLMIINREKDDAEFIKKSFSEWSELKGEFSPILKKLVEAWETEADMKEELSYFG